MNLIKAKEKYINASIAHGLASDVGNSRIANREYYKLSRIYHELEKDKEVANDFYEELLQFPNYLVQIWVAAHLLGMNLNVDMALKMLDRISKMENIGIIRFTAEMTIKEWKKNGYLIF